MDPSATAAPAGADAASLGGASVIPAPSRHATSLRRLAATAAGFVVVAAIFLLSHPYRGITHDGLIYVGQALAAADPAGLGRDMLFAHDEQSRFSLYPRVAGALIGALGPASAARLLALAGLLAWLAAAAVLARRMADGRLLWACLVTVAVLPSAYGGFGVFRAAEAFATPRPLAEAAVLLGLAAALAGRPRASLAFMAVGVLLHPLMAIPGLGVWLLFGGPSAWRWLLPAGFVAVLAVAAASMIAPVGAIIDPAWQEALAANAYLFPFRWPAESWAHLAVKAGTVAVAFRALAGPARRLCIAVLIVGGLGLATSLAGSAGEPLLLITQLQPWRALWLLAVLAALLLPMAASHLWGSGPAGRVALPLLLIAWLPVGSPVLIGLALTAALALMILARRIDHAISPPLVGAATLAVASLAALLWCQRAAAVAELVSTKPSGVTALGEIAALSLMAIPAVVIALAVAFSRPIPVRLGPLAAMSAALAILAGIAWDDRSAATRLADLRQPDPVLVQLLPDLPGEVLWLRNGARHAWALAGRPSWASYMQGAAMVFSRPLAMTWGGRMDRLVTAHLADASDRDPHGGHEPEILRPSLRDVASLCAAPDGPVAIIAPDDGSVWLPEGLPRRTYVPPAGEVRPEIRDGRPAWTGPASFTAVDCGRVFPL